MKEYTVVVVSFEYCSYFNCWVSAESPEKAGEKACDYADGETGIPGYETLAIFEGCQKNLASGKIFDWR